MKTTKNKAKVNTKKENPNINDVQIYSKNLVKNLINEANENSENISFFENQYEEDFYTKEVNIPKNTYPSTPNRRKELEKYRNDFFEEYDDDEFESGFGFFKVISITLIVLLTISTIILAISLFKTKTSLAESKIQLQELLDKSNTVEEKLVEENLREEISKLEEENQKLQQTIDELNQTSTEEDSNTSSTPSSTTSSNTASNSTNSNTTNSNTTSNSTNSSNEYVVQSGDSFWSISLKVYGNGADYQKILDANGLTENSILQEGEKLIIP